MRYEPNITLWNEAVAHVCPAGAFSMWKPLTLNPWPYKHAKRGTEFPTFDEPGQPPNLSNSDSALT